MLGVFGRCSSVHAILLLYSFRSLCNLLSRPRSVVVPPMAYRLSSLGFHTLSMSNLTFRTCRCYLSSDDEREASEEQSYSWALSPSDMDKAFSRRTGDTALKKNRLALSSASSSSSSSSSAGERLRSSRELVFLLVFTLTTLRLSTLQIASMGRSARSQDRHGCSRAHS